MEIIFVIVGFIFTAFGGYFLFDTYNFRKISQMVTGRLVGYESHISKSSKGGTSTMYAPVVEFLCNGETYSFKATISSNTMPYKIGESVPVIYLENDPHNARLRTNTRYIIGGAFALMGVVVLTIGVVNFQYNRTSLFVAAGVLAFLIYKIIKVKSRFNAKGINSLKDLKNSDKTGDDLLDGLTEHNAHDTTDKNYRPSESLITNQATVVKGQKIPKWVPYLLIVIGLGLLAGGVFWGQKRANFLADAETTQGKIVSMESSTSDGSTVYYPIVKYTFPHSNQTVRFKHNVGSSHPGWRTGDTVPVLFNPVDKNEAMIDDGWMNWLGPGILAGMGTFFFFVGFSVSRRQKRLRG
jgi:hypothetical protein